MRDFIIGLLYILVQIAIVILTIPLVIVVMAAIFTVGCEAFGGNRPRRMYET